MSAREKKWTGVGLVIVGALGIAGAWIASKAQVSGIEPFNLHNLPPVSVGDDCQPPYDDTSGVYVASNGSLIRCDPTEGKWKMLTLRATEILSQLPGKCESFGDNADDYCQEDDDCADHASCSGAVCNCELNDPFILSVYPRASDDSYRKFGVRFDSPSDATAPYPPTLDIEDVNGRLSYRLGMSSVLGTTCADPGCTVLDINLPNFVIGDSRYDIANLAVYGKLSLTGQGSGAIKTGGFIDGYIDSNSNSGGGDHVRFNRAHSSTVSMGEITSPDGDDVCFDWFEYEGGTSGVRSFGVCRDEHVRYSGTHDGSSGASILRDSRDEGFSFPDNGLVGWLAVNTTDSSWCVIDTSTNIHAGCGLEDGTDNDWDSGDSYEIREPVLELDSAAMTGTRSNLFFASDGMAAATLVAGKTLDIPGVGTSSRLWGHVMPRDGSIVSISIGYYDGTGPSAANEGTILYRIRKAADSPTVLMDFVSPWVDSAGTHSWHQEVARGQYTFSAGDMIHVYAEDNDTYNVCESGSTEEGAVCGDNSDCTGGTCTSEPLTPGATNYHWVLVEVIFDE